MTSAAGEHPRWLDPLSQSLAALPAPPKGGALFVPTFRKQAPPEWNDFPRPGEDGEARKGNGWRTQ